MTCMNMQMGETKTPAVEAVMIDNSLCKGDRSLLLPSDAGTAQRHQMYLNRIQQWTENWLVFYGVRSGYPTV